jgi:ketosteroid isomerase-like protein
MTQAVGPRQLEENKRIVSTVFLALREGRFDDAFALMDDGGVHRGGAYPYEPHPLEHFKAKLRLVQEGVHDTPMGFVIGNVVAEGDQVVLELTNDGTFPDGRPYDIAYCFVCRVSGGKVVSMVEYADTKYAADLRPEIFARDSPLRASLGEASGQLPVYD